jgi:hypothetical protein
MSLLTIGLKRSSAPLGLGQRSVAHAASSRDHLPLMVSLAEPFALVVLLLPLAETVAPLTESPASVTSAFS